MPYIKPNKHTVKILSNKTKEQISKSLTGIKHTEERKKNISMGTKLAMPNRKEISVYSSGKLIATYLSAKDLKHSIHYINRKYVKQCVQDGQIELNNILYKLNN